MTPTKLVVNKQDRIRLQRAIDSARSSWRTYGPYLDWLRSQLDEAQVCDPSEMPEDVVTMNSRVELKDLRSGRMKQLELVYPGEQTQNAEQVSIFEPTGLALFGSRVGDVVGWNESDRVRTARLEQLCYQPESAGDLHL